jgi:crossover junction endodeoxyribonuclease RuvC
MRRAEKIVRVLGVDPGTARTGWGIVDCKGRSLTFRAGGVVSTKGFHSMPERLRVVHAGITEVIDQWTPPP